MSRNGLSVAVLVVVVVLEQPLFAVLDIVELLMMNAASVLVAEQHRLEDVRSSRVYDDALLVHHVAPVQRPVSLWKRHEPL